MPSDIEKAPIIEMERHADDASCLHGATLLTLCSDSTSREHYECYGTCAKLGAGHGHGLPRSAAAHANYLSCCVLEQSLARSLRL